MKEVPQEFLWSVGETCLVLFPGGDKQFISGA